jgi:hypothetical protein
LLSIDLYGPLFTITLKIGLKYETR